VNSGDRIQLVGPNGADKSTLFSLILNDLSPDSGKISLEKECHIALGSPPAREIR
jgi:ATP-binding cassette, subfamily F, member 3